MRIDSVSPCGCVTWETRNGKLISPCPRHRQPKQRKAN